MANAHSSSRPKRHRPVDPTQFTPFYRSRAQAGAKTIFCEDVSLEAVAQSAGTPAYVYSRAGIESSYRTLDKALAGIPHTLCYAMKANANLSILRTLADLGSSFDIVSGGELDRLRRIGVPGDRIVFSGVGKTRDEIRDALRYRGPDNTGRQGICLFNIESEPELEVFLEE